MLHELVAYADTHLADSEPGFTTREVRWSIEVCSDGRFLNVVPLGDGKSGTHLPRCPETPAMNAGGKAHFLVETAQTVALLCKPGEDEKSMEGARKRHRFYAQLVCDAAASTARLKVVAALLEDALRLNEIRAALSANKAKPADWVTWQIDHTDPRLDGDVQAW